MASSPGAVERSIKLLKEVVSIIEKKKRNLEKRKNKLEEYKVKGNLNDDQRLALSKYDEVVASIDVLDELFKLVSAHTKEFSKEFEELIENERRDRIESETSVLAESLKAFICISNFSQLLRLDNVPIKCLSGLSDDQINRLLLFQKDILHFTSGSLPHGNALNKFCIGLLSLYHEDSSLITRSKKSDVNVKDINSSLKILNTSKLSEVLQSCGSVDHNKLSSILDSCHQFNHISQSTTKNHCNSLHEAQFQPKANFNFLHSSSVLANEEPILHGDIDTNPQTSSESTAIINGKPRSQKQRLAQTPNGHTNDHTRKSKEQHEFSRNKSRGTRQQRQQVSKVVPTPLMELNPKTTLSLENSKVLAEASGLNLSDLLNNNNTKNSRVSSGDKNVKSVSKSPRFSSTSSKNWPSKEDQDDVLQTSSVEESSPGVNRPSLATSTSPANSFQGSENVSIGSHYCNPGRTPNKSAQSQIGNIFDMLIKSNTQNGPDCINSSTSPSNKAPGSNKSSASFQRDISELMLSDISTQGTSTEHQLQQQHFNGQSNLFHNMRGANNTSTSNQHIMMSNYVAPGSIGSTPGVQTSTTSVSSNQSFMPTAHHMNFSQPQVSSVASSQNGQANMYSQFISPSQTGSHGRSAAGIGGESQKEEAISFLRQIMITGGANPSSAPGSHLHQGRPAHLGAVGQQPPIGTGPGVHHQQHPMINTGGSIAAPGARMPPGNGSGAQTVFGNA